MVKGSDPNVELSTCSAKKHSKKELFESVATSILQGPRTRLKQEHIKIVNLSYKRLSNHNTHLCCSRLTGLMKIEEARREALDDTTITVEVAVSVCSDYKSGDDNVL